MKMKRYYLLLLAVFLLSACSLNKSQSEVSQAQPTEVENNIENKATENITKQAQQAVKDVEKNVQKTALSANKTKSQVVQSSESLAQIEQKKLREISNLKSGLYFYWLDCKKLFKLPENIKKCEMWWLKEAWYSCLDKSYFKNMSVDQIFNKKKFDLIDDETIQKYKNMCLQQIKEIKEEQKKQQELMKKQQELMKKIQNFKLSDCDKLANKQHFETFTVTNWKKITAEQQKKDFILRCKIGYAIKYKKDCSILPADLKQKCEQIKKDLDYYNKLLQEERIYGKFDLD